MSLFDTALTAFQQSRIAYEELLTAARALNAQSDAVIEAARQLLESEYRAGRLATEVYFGLQAALPQQDKDLTPRRAKQLAKAGNQLADVLQKDIAPLLMIKIGKVK